MTKFLLLIGSLLTAGGLGVATSDPLVDVAKVRSETAAAAVYSTYTAAKPLIQVAPDVKAEVKAEVGDVMRAAGEAEAKPAVKEHAVKLPGPASPRVPLPTDSPSKPATLPRVPLAQPVAVPRMLCGPNGCQPQSRASYGYNYNTAAPVRRGLLGRRR